MNELNELMTRESGPVVRLLEKLERTLAEVGRLTENYRPVLGGERYLTDREVAQLLKTSDAPCRNTGMRDAWPISSWEEKSSTASRTSSGCCVRATARRSITGTDRLPMTAFDLFLRIGGAEDKCGAQAGTILPPCAALAI